MTTTIIFAFIGLLLGIIVIIQSKKIERLENELKQEECDHNEECQKQDDYIMEKVGEITMYETEIEIVKKELSESKEREKLAKNIIADKRKEIDAINTKWEMIEQSYKDKVKELQKQLKK